MNNLKNITPQDMLEEAFRALYDRDSEDEAKRVQEEKELFNYQIEWSNKFKDTFAFVSEYGAKMEMSINSDLDVKSFNIDKCSIQVFNGIYSLTVFPPRPGTDRCKCLEHYLYDYTGNKVLFLTLPEITIHISKGLAKSNADKKHIY